MNIPASHITDAQKLRSDGIVELFQLDALVGGTLYFKNGHDVTWRSNDYVGIPCALSDFKRSSEQVSMQPRLTIGEENINLSIFKPLLFDGGVDGGTLIYRRVLLDHILSNTDISEINYFRIKRVESYSRTQIVLSLSGTSDSLSFSLPSQQYYPPAFPSVQM